MKDILADIIANKRVEVERAKKDIPIECLLEKQPPRQHVSMFDSLSSSASGIMAEFKRKSPSKGLIHADAMIEEIAPAYQRGGASAMSVLTDNKFFGGSLEDLATARNLVDIPLLRKDFIIDTYQLAEARAIGADAVLLIAAALTPEQCAQLADAAASMGLEVLLELHDESELRYVNDGIKMVGVNNRNLGSFHTDVYNSFRIADKLPEGKLLISESGISNPQTVKRLRGVGFRGFLIGENFMKETDPGQALAEFIHKLS